MVDMDRLLSALLDTKSALLADVRNHPGAPESLLVRSDLTGTMQLYELTLPESLRQVTSLAEPIATARYVPGSRRAVVEVDRGGDERHQLYLVELDVAYEGPVGPDALHPLTADPRYVHRIAGTSPDGRLLAYLSNRANGVDFDLWVCDLASREHTRVYATGSWCQPSSGFSPDGSRISIIRPGPRPLDAELLLVEMNTGEASQVLAHEDEAASVGSPAWVDASSFFVSTNVRSDHEKVVRHDLVTGSSTPVAGTGEEWDAHPVASASGNVLLVIENLDGAHRMTVADTASPGIRTEVPLVEPGVVMSHAIAPPLLSADGSCVYFTLSTPRIAGDVWSWNRNTGESRRLTTSPAPIDPQQLVGAELSRCRELRRRDDPDIHVQASDRDASNHVWRTSCSGAHPRRA